MKDRYINKFVWTAPEPTMIIFGRIMETDHVNGWLSFRVDWKDDLPRHVHPEWVKAANVSFEVPQMLQFMFNECR